MSTVDRAGRTHTAVPREYLFGLAAVAGAGRDHFQQYRV